MANYILPQWFAFAHIISVPKLKIARNCYFLYASHPDLEGIFPASVVHFVHITSVLKL